MDEPVRDTRDVEIVLYADDNARPGAGPPPRVGSVERFRPTMRVVAFIAHRDFDRVWTLALSGLLKHAHIVMTPPRFQSAFVVSVSFSTLPEE